MPTWICVCLLLETNNKSVFILVRTEERTKKKNEKAEDWVAILFLSLLRERRDERREERWIRVCLSVCVCSGGTKKTAVQYL